MLKTGLGLGAGLIAFAMAAPAAANTIYVNINQDNPATDGFCSLREAIVASNLGSTVDTCVASSGYNKIVLGAGTYSIKPSLGAIGVTSYIQLVGQGYKKTVIQQDASQATSTSAGVFIVNLAGSLDVSSVHFTKFKGRILTVNGSGTSANVSFTKMSNNLGNFFSGGTCVANIGGDLTISDSELSECEGTSGGAVFNSGTASIENTTLLKNHSERGGAILNNSGGTLYITSSTIGNNKSNVYGGAIQNGGSAYISSSTIAYNGTDVENDSCTSSDLMCSAVQNVSGAYMEISGSVIAHNTTGVNQTKPNCIGLPSSTGGNLLGEASGTACAVTTLAGAAPNVTPQNAGLHNSSGDPLWYGGVGRTYMPTTTSPLLNKIAVGFGPCGDRDQRGLRRWSGSTCDVGAVERAPALMVVGNTTLSSGDGVLKFLLENMGFGVTVQSGASATTASADGKLLVVISESVTSTDVNTKFRDVGTGVMVLESALFDDMRMTGTTNNTDYGVTNDFGIILQPGLITNSFGAMGYITTTSATVSQSWGVPDVNTSRLGTLNSSTSRWGLFAYYPGTYLVPNTFYAQGYRVGAFATDAAMGSLTVDGGDILRQAMLFAAR